MRTANTYASARVPYRDAASSARRAVKLWTAPHTAGVERRIDDALNIFANQIPAGGLSAERAKAEVIRILDRMQRSGEDRLGAIADAQRHETLSRSQEKD